MQQRKVGATSFCKQVAPRRFFCVTAAFCSLSEQEAAFTEENAPLTAIFTVGFYPPDELHFFPTHFGLH
jgi:hypothetical protein